MGTPAPYLGVLHGTPAPYLALLHGHGILLAPLQPHAVEMLPGAVQGSIHALPSLLDLGERTAGWEHTGGCRAGTGLAWSPPHPYQLDDAVELGQDPLGAVLDPLQLTQRAPQGSVPQLGRERAHADEVALPPPLPLRPGHLHACRHRCGGQGVRTVWLDHPVPGTGASHRRRWDELPLSSAPRHRAAHPRDAWPPGHVEVSPKNQVASPVTSAVTRGQLCPPLPRAKL